jgi:hypothetical protein
MPKNAWECLQTSPNSHGCQQTLTRFSTKANASNTKAHKKVQKHVKACEVTTFSCHFENFKATFCRPFKKFLWQFFLAFLKIRRQLLPPFSKFKTTFHSFLTTLDVLERLVFCFVCCAIQILFSAVESSITFLGVGVKAIPRTALLLSRNRNI